VLGPCHCEELSYIVIARSLATKQSHKKKVEIAALPTVARNEYYQLGLKNQKSEYH